MNIWLVNPFDPLPGTPEQAGRYITLAQTLAARGHNVTWWSSTFSHRFKEHIDELIVEPAARLLGIDVRLIDTPPYLRNVSLARLRNHAAFGRQFAAEAARATRPHVIFASSPPLESAYQAAKLGRRWNVPTIIDIQDQWPDVFVRAFPQAIRWAAPMALAGCYWLERRAYSLAAGLVGVADGYLERGVAVGGRKQHRGVFPLGVELGAVDAAIYAGTSRHGDQWTKPPEEVWFLYSGSISHSYDFLTILEAARLAQERGLTQARFIITGRGDLSAVAEDFVAQHAAQNTTLTGFLDFDEWACVLGRCDAGFNACQPDSLIYLPNKIFYYLAGGLVVLNNIPGQCERIVRANACGIHYAAGDAESCYAAVRTLVENSTERQSARAASRKLAESEFDRAIIYPRLAEFIESAADPGIRDSHR
jgi:glycosyltransferase involved in cell wall biosynthesis